MRKVLLIGLVLSIISLIIISGCTQVATENVTQDDLKAVISPEEQAAALTGQASSAEQMGKINQIREKIAWLECSDSDGGQKALVVGQVSYVFTLQDGQESSGVISDECKSNQEVMEYYCNGDNQLAEKDFFCPEGNECVAGACVPSSPAELDVAPSTPAVLECDHQAKVYLQDNEQFTLDNKFIEVKLNNITSTAVDFEVNGVDTGLISLQKPYLFDDHSRITLLDFKDGKVEERVRYAEFCFQQAKTIELLKVVDDTRYGAHYSYVLQWTDGSKNSVKMPLAFISDDEQFGLGKSFGNSLVLKEDDKITKGDFFVLRDGSKSYLLQYKGTTDNGALLLNRYGVGGEFLSKTSADSSFSGIIPLSASKNYGFQKINGSAKDSALMVDLDGNGKVSSSSGSFKDYYGSSIDIQKEDDSISVMIDGLKVNIFKDENDNLQAEFVTGCELAENPDKKTCTLNSGADLDWFSGEPAKFIYLYG